MNMAENLGHRISNGSLDQHRVAIAAALGSEAAIATGVELARLDEHYRTRIEQVAVSLTQSQCIMFCYECATRALLVWENMFPLDLRPSRAVEAVESWLSGNDTRADYESLSKAAAQAHIEVDYPELTEDVDPGRCAAMEAAAACSYAALTVVYVLENKDHRKMSELTAWVARSGVKAAIDRRAETEWQTGRLIAMLLE